MESGLLEKISDNPPYAKGLIKQAIRTGYSNENILKALSSGIGNDIKSYKEKKINEKIFPLSDRLALKRTYRNRCIKYEMLQSILKQEDLPDGKKLHYYMKAVNLPTLADLDIFASKITHENKEEKQ